MSLEPIGPDSGLQRLSNEGYQVEVCDQHLILRNVPYVNSNRTIARGTLVCTYVKNAGAVLPPDNHTVWWAGEYPCFSTGQPITQIRNEDVQREIFPGCIINHRFSNKPVGTNGFSDHYTKMVHYINLIQAQAKSIDSNADARGNRQNPISKESESPFVYADSASAKADIQATSNRLALKKVAIIGVGGTGSYILDQVAKTPVKEIHLYDGDIFLQHNAFRSPGAASEQALSKRLNKTDYFKGIYDAMHRGIVSHPIHIDSGNVGEIINFDFVFICVDGGGVRQLMFKHLLEKHIPFIDVGLNLHLVPSTGKLVGSCRFTYCTPEQNEHFEQYAPMEVEDEDALYHQNVQIADMNALNAQLAVMKWKQHFGFYQDDFKTINGTFSVNSMSLARNVTYSDTDNEAD